MLYVHRSERSDQLVEILGDLLAEPLADAMAPEVIAVPTRGVERWLSQRLSHRLGTGPGRRDGVCANVDFPFPGSLITRATAAACGYDPDDDPWVPTRSVWSLLEVVDGNLDEPWLKDLADHLRSLSGEGPVRRFPTARHLADLFDHYGVHRPQMLLDWNAGREAGHWQAELWRRLRSRIGVASPAERLAATAGRLVAEPDLLDLPDRLSLFGLTRLPSSHLAVLEAVAAGRDVHLFLLHPSGSLWDQVAPLVPAPGSARLRGDDPTAELARHPLLRSWGRDAREMQLVLSAHGAGAGEYRPVPAEPSTLLGRLQADIRADRPMPPAADTGADPHPMLDAADDSVQIHSCHGRYRQVEVMRDAILHLLARDATLEPRDVIVMCPDIEAFAPLVHAAFGHDEADEVGPESTGHTEASSLPEVRVRLADRSLRQTNPLLSVADALLQLAAGRVTASQIVDLSAREPVRRRFQFDDDELAQIERWVVDMGVRWGLDAAHRAEWGLRDLPANSWSAGLDRLLLGVAMADEEQRLFGGALPLDDVSSGSVHLAGRLAELVSRVHDAVDRLGRRQPVAAWCRILIAATDGLAEPAAADSWQRDQLHRVLDEVLDEAGAGAVELELSEVQSLLSHRLQGQPTRANFRTGDLTICTLVPMRSVPHRVIGLLGLDDGVFPRHPERDGDDLLLKAPCIGDRDPRSEDRQLLLDAVLAATDRLIITYSGRDDRTNHVRPPAVPVAELLDVIDRTVRPPIGKARVRDAVTVEHPLQPFDPKNFVAGRRAGANGPWSFDRINLEGARALSVGSRRLPRPWLEAPLPPVPNDVVQLDTLVRFVEHPVRAFLRERLGIYARDRSDEINDDLPIELDGLERWAVGDRVLTARLGGATPERAVAAELARGLLPPGSLGTDVLDRVSPTVEALVSAVAGLPVGSVTPQSIEVNLALPDGRRLIGTVDGLRETVILRALYSRLGPKHRLAAWVRHLAVAAAFPELPLISITVGRGRPARGDQQFVAQSTFGVPAVAAPLDRLAVLVDLYDRGMREPLPIYCNTSAAWVASRRSGHDHDRVEESARREWTQRDQFAGEDHEGEHRLVLGGIVGFDQVKRGRPAAAESGPGWDETEDTRFGRLAERLWSDLLDAEDWRESS